MPANDPYAAYGGKVADDPYKEYGGSVSAQVGSTPESMGITNPIPVSQGVPPQLRGPVTMGDRIKAGQTNGTPGSFEGKPENVGDYIPNGPGQMLMGAKDVLSGNFAKGTHKIISGAGATALPVAAIVAPQAALAAPAATALGVGASAAGAYVAGKGADALGATPDQSAVASDIGGMAGGIGAVKAADLLKGPASRVLLLGKTPQGAYESALKPSTTLSQAERDSVVNTGLQEGIPVSKGGANQLSELVGKVNDEIAKTIQSNPDAPISRDAATSTIPGLKAKFSKQVAPSNDLNAIDNVVNDFKASQPATIRAEDAQAIKQGTYQRIGDRGYGEVGSATTEAEKALARGLKDELATQFPELKGLNARDSKLYELQDVLERAVARNGNHQILGIGTPVVAGAAKAVTDSNKIAAAAAVIKGVLDNPTVKSRLAIALIHAGVTPETAVQRLNSYAGALSAQSVRGSQQTPAVSAQPDGSPPNQ